MKVLVKKLHEDAVIPKYAYNSDAGCDLVAVTKNETERYIEYGTGLAFEIDSFESQDWYFEIFPRSSLSNYDLILCNSVGVVDNSFRGEVKFRFKKVKSIREELLKFIKSVCQAWECDFDLVDNLIDVFKIIKNYKFNEYKTYEIGDKIGQMILKKRPKIEFEEVEKLTETDRNAGGYGSSGK